MNLCECGCGASVKKRFVKGHQSIGKKMSEETKFKLREHNLGKVLPADVREKISRNHSKHFLGKTHSEETKAKISDKRSKQGREPHTEEAKKKISSSSKGKVFSDMHKAKLSDAAKLRERRPTTEETKRKIGDANRKNWANGVYDSFQTDYSSYELRLAPVVIDLGFKSTIEKKFYIKSKDRVRIPDFVNMETKQVIEIFGTYWHRDRKLPDGQRHETPEEYIAWYHNLGWHCVVVWAEEEFDEYYKKKVEQVNAKKRCD